MAQLQLSFLTSYLIWLDNTEVALGQNVEVVDGQADDGLDDVETEKCGTAI